jgi:hypothetical protein
MQAGCGRQDDVGGDLKTSVIGVGNVRDRGSDGGWQGNESIISGVGSVWSGDLTIDGRGMDSIVNGLQRDSAIITYNRISH